MGGEREREGNRETQRGETERRDSVVAFYWLYRNLTCFFSAKVQEKIRKVKGAVQNIVQCLSSEEPLVKNACCKSIMEIAKNNGMSIHFIIKPKQYNGQQEEVITTTLVLFLLTFFFKIKFKMKFVSWILLEFL